MIQMIKEPRELQLSSSSSMTETAIQARKFINKEDIIKGRISIKNKWTSKIKQKGFLEQNLLVC
jgi:hypothetical protein